MNDWFLLKIVHFYRERDRERERGNTKNDKWINS